MPTSKSMATSDTASAASALINHLDGHQVTRVNAVAIDIRSFNELHAHYIHALLASGLSQHSRALSREHCDSTRT
ncbi:hypothetical protein CERZMDRAFT_101837 [Cercospora zeae-maydis SCOH1-5]|uniref:Uncharacterized protein n=1 Tax=Cercospora zeae-maydis SCOH1-5 TaxID=717836 RepID=A0A6A6F214_9PEZI|nr:hypothetical protein CERZMDRAFT_101837 [Cercospora zeae-maydis SCOH1-5]